LTKTSKARESRDVGALDDWRARGTSAKHKMGVELFEVTVSQVGGEERSMVIAGVRSLWIVATLLTWGTAALAQPPSAPVNPRAIEFDFPAEGLSDIVGYWVEVFRSGPVTLSTPPVRVIYLARASRGSKGGLRVELGNDLDGLADGEYVATLNVVGRFGQSPFSEPSEPFALSGRASRPPPHAEPAVRSVPTKPTPQPAPVAAEAKPNNEPISKWWTVAIVGILVSVLVSIF
jgi:hypothetical protein